ncbi:DUF6017 domain-containing protein [Oscillibacter sp.]|uniref:DUF6017 domain-containing protein n=1 Tax=Oscillibacter sp. TaxID=1945593 RepID=UPI0028A229F1|nr:DUF6017 domain-containing protein [Oscillibacter sp.]
MADETAIDCYFGDESNQFSFYRIPHQRFTTRTTVRIGGEDIPTDQGKDRFYRLGNLHPEYVFDCLRRNTTDIHNIGYNAYYKATHCSYGFSIKFSTLCNASSASMSGTVPIS